MPLEITFET